MRLNETSKQTNRWFENSSIFLYLKRLQNIDQREKMIHL
jgi:hypothetical protein